MRDLNKNNLGFSLNIVLILALAVALLGGAIWYLKPLSLFSSNSTNTEIPKPSLAVKNEVSESQPVLLPYSFTDSENTQKILNPNKLGKTSPLYRDFKAYNNYDFNFSFLFPAKWNLIISSYSMDFGVVQISLLEKMLDRVGGSNEGLIINYYSISSKTSVRDFIAIFMKDKGLDFDKMQAYKSKNPNITVYLDKDRSTAGNRAQEAVIADNFKNQFISVSCLEKCIDSELTQLIDTLEFKTEYSSETPTWYNFYTTETSN